MGQRSHAVAKSFFCNFVVYGQRRTILRPRTCEGRSNEINTDHKIELLGLLAVRQRTERETPIKIRSCWAYYSKPHFTYGQQGAN